MYAGVCERSTLAPTEHHNRAQLHSMACKRLYARRRCEPELISEPSGEGDLQLHSSYNSPQNRLNVQYAYFSVHISLKMFLYNR